MPIHGLTAAEVESRRAAGLTNCPPRSPTKTTGEIVRDNICTYFNLVFLVLALMLLSVGSWLTKDHRSGHIIHRLTKAVYRFTVRLHITLLKMSREAA